MSDTKTRSKSQKGISVTCKVNNRERSLRTLSAVISDKNKTRNYLSLTQNTIKSFFSAQTAVDKIGVKEEKKASIHYNRWYDDVDLCLKNKEIAQKQIKKRQQKGHQRKRTPIDQLLIFDKIISPRIKLTIRSKKIKF